MPLASWLFSASLILQTRRTQIGTEGNCMPISTLNAAYASIMMATKHQHTVGHADASCVPTEAQSMQTCRPQCCKRLYRH